MSRTSFEQLRIMVEYMEEKGDLSKAVGGIRARQQNSLDWKELTHKLNNVHRGPRKPVIKWRRVWTDYKSNLKRKLVQYRLTSADEEKLRQHLTDLEMKILPFLGSESAFEASFELSKKSNLTKPRKIRRAASDPAPESNNPDRKQKLDDITATNGNSGDNLDGDCDNDAFSARSDPDEESNGENTASDTVNQSGNKWHLTNPSLRTNFEQLSIMVEFMEEKGDLSKIESGIEAKYKNTLAWDELTQKLNGVQPGVQRSVIKWRRVWTDYKANLKRKIINFSAIDEPNISQNLSDLEMRMIKFLDPENVFDPAFGLCKGRADGQPKPKKIQRTSSHPAPENLPDNKRFKYVHSPTTVGNYEGVDLDVDPFAAVKCSLSSDSDNGTYFARSEPDEEEEWNAGNATKNKTPTGRRRRPVFRTRQRNRGKKTATFYAAFNAFLRAEESNRRQNREREMLQIQMQRERLELETRRQQFMEDSFDKLMTFLNNTFMKCKDEDH